MISGFTIARNVVKLGYPITQAIQSYRPAVDELILAYDPWPDDGTDEWAKKIAEDLDLRLFESKWEVTETGQMRFDPSGANEVAIQTAKAAEQCRYDWTLSVEADEGFHEDMHEEIRELTEKFPSYVTGIDFDRACFYKDIRNIRLDWCSRCTRLIRKGTHYYMVPGGSMSSAPITGTHERATFWLYHYVRIGDPMAISRRIRNLDTFYHDPSTLIPEDELQPYDFKHREFDNTSLVAAKQPKEVEGELRAYQGTHPWPFAELYQDDE